MGLATFAKLSSASQASYWTGLVADRGQRRASPGRPAAGETGKDAPGAYYAGKDAPAQVAPGAHDHGPDGYYDGHGEKPGAWIGAGCADLGLDGIVDAEAFHALLEGRDPVTGIHLQARPKIDPDTGQPLLDPETGQPVMELPWFLQGKERTPGFDMTFSADKSVSALWATGTAEQMATIESAHEEAVSLAVAYIEANAVRVRRGEHGVVDPETGRERGLQFKADGLVAARFQHRTSRAGDPQLHTHVVVANVAKGPDGRYTSLDAIELYDHYRTAGAIYNAALRDIMSEELGVAWTRADDKGLQSIIGVPAKLTGAWSKRRNQIEQEVLDRGGDLENAEHRQAANLKTRAGKEGGATTQELRAGWAAEARAVGVEPEQLWAQVARGAELARRKQALERLAGAMQARLGVDGWTAKKLTDELRQYGVPGPEIAQTVDDLLLSDWASQSDTDRYALDLLTRNSTTFSRRDLVRKLAEMGSLADLDVRVDALLNSSGALMLSTADRAQTEVNGRTYRTRDWAGVWTTPEVLAAEQRLLEAAAAGKRRGAGLTSREIFDSILAKRSTLENDQIEMLDHLLTSGDELCLVVGLAGAGKTYALEAAREGWVAGGYTVIGCSTAAVAAAGLEKDAGISSSTVASLLGALESGSQVLEAGTVIVVDEAGMTSTRDLDRLVHHAKEANARSAAAGNNAAAVKVVLVGDDRQLAAVEAGGMFRTLREDHPDLVATLTSNKRQANEWERQLLARLRTATPEQADAVVREYASRGRVVAGPERESVMDRMASDYWNVRTSTIADQRTGKERQATALLLAGQRADVDSLNRAALAEAVDRGLLDPTAGFTFGDKEWLVGQQVLTAQNQRKAGVLNGYIGKVEGVAQRPTAWDVTVRFPDGREKTFVSRQERAVGDTFEMGRSKGGDSAAVEVIAVSSQADSFEAQLQVTLDDDGRTVFLPETYVRDHLSSGYAMTVHRAQGRTVDAGMMYAVGMSREAFYVAMSRGRGVTAGDETLREVVQNRMYTVGDEALLDVDQSHEFGERLRSAKVTAVTDTRTLATTMAEDYWDLANPGARERREAAARLADADQRVQDLLLDPAASLSDEGEALKARAVAQQEVDDLHTSNERGTPIMMALRSANVVQLNAQAIARGVQLGELSGETYEFGGREWHVGQRAMVARADKARDLDRGQMLTVEGVEEVPAKWSATIELPGGRIRTMRWSSVRSVGDNVTVRGETGVVTAVEVTATEERLVLRDADGRRVEGNAKWAEAHARDGYAVTLGRANEVAASDHLVFASGIEDEAQALIAEGTDHRWYVVGKADKLTLTPAEQAYDRMMSELGAQAKRSGSGQSATDVARSRVEEAGSVGELQEERRACAAMLDKCPKGASAQRARAEAAVRSTQAGLEAAGAGGSPELVQEWAAKAAAARAHLADLTPGVDGTPAKADQDRAAWLAANRGWVERYSELGARLDSAATLRLAAMEMQPPAYAPERGESLMDRNAWREKMQIIEAYRTRWGVTDQATPMGSRPRSSSERREWELAGYQVHNVDERLAGRTASEPTREHDAGLSAA